MTKYQVFLIVVFLFFFGSGGGWVLELFFRRFFSGANPERKWLNPGFLFGPCVPLYGFGTVVLFILSEFESQIFGQFGGSWWYYLVMFFGMALAMTALEYIAGLMSLFAIHDGYAYVSAYEGNDGILYRLNLRDTNDLQEIARHPTAGGGDPFFNH